MIRAIVFDVGGTLIYPARPVGETYARLAQNFGETLDPHDTLAAFRKAFKACSPRGAASVPRNGDDREWWKKVVRQSLPDTHFVDPTTFEHFFDEAYLYYAKPEAWSHYPEVPEILNSLQKLPLKLVVLTNWDARVHPVLDGLGIGTVFSQRFVSAELGLEKPNSAIYSHVEHALGVPPSEILSVGDEQENDIDGPACAGWLTLKIDRPSVDLRALSSLLP